MLDEKSKEYWIQFSKADWENPKGNPVAAFVRLRNERKETGFCQHAKKACESTGADFDQFLQHTAEAIHKALDDDKNRYKSNNSQPFEKVMKIVNPAGLVNLGSVEPKEMCWIWKPYIPSGNMTIIQGDPGSGKTHLAAWLTAMITKGDPAPDGSEIEQGSVIFQSMEDGLAEGLVPRLISVGAVMNKVYCFNENDAPLFVQDHSRIEAAFLEISDVKMFIVDPIQSYLGTKTDMNKANEIRSALKGLVSLCHKYNVALVIIGHMGKAQNKNLYRLLGSVDFIAQARSFLTVGENMASPDERIVLPTKTSNEKHGEPFAFKITDNGAQFVGFRPGLTEYNLCQLPSTNDSRVDETIKFVMEVLEDQPLTVNELEKVGREIDLKPITLRRAREKLKIDNVIEVRKVGQHGHWYWFLRKKQVFETKDRLFYHDHIDQDEKYNCRCRSMS